jgi:hypothetical protein
MVRYSKRRIFESSFFDSTESQLSAWGLKFDTRENIQVEQLLCRNIKRGDNYEDYAELVRK